MGKNDGSALTIPRPTSASLEVRIAMPLSLVKSLSSRWCPFHQRPSRVYEDADYVTATVRPAPLTLGGISGCRATCLPTATWITFAYGARLSRLRLSGTAGIWRRRQSTYLPFLVAEYLDEGAIDSHDGEHDLSIDPARPSLTTPYKRFTATGSILFDGADTLVTVPYGADLAPSLEFTFEAWIKPDVGATEGRYVASMGDRGWAVMLMCDGTGAGCCEGGSHVNGSVGLYANVSSSFTCQDVPSSTAAVNGGEWTHVAITLATPHTKMNPRGVSAKVCFVINGVSRDVSSTTLGISPGIAGGEALVIGGASVEGACVDCETEPLKFMGHMSNVHIWREALDPMVIERYMARRLTHAHPYYDALVAAFPFSERTFISTGVDDTKTGAFDAVLTNGTFNATEFVAQDSSSSATMGDRLLLQRCGSAYRRSLRSCHGSKRSSHHRSLD